MDWVGLRGVGAGLLGAGLLMSCSGGGGGSAALPPPPPVVDRNPDPFLVPKVQTLLPVGTPVPSMPVTVTGFTGPLPLTISGGGRVSADGGPFAETLSVNPGACVIFEVRAPASAATVSYTITLGSFTTVLLVEGLRQPMSLPALTAVPRLDGIDLKWAGGANLSAVASYSYGFNEAGAPEPDASKWVWHASPGKLPSVLILSPRGIEPWGALGNYRTVELQGKIPFFVAVRDGADREGRTPTQVVTLPFSPTYAAVIENAGFPAGFDHLPFHVKLVLGDSAGPYKNNAGSTLTFTALSEGSLDDVDWTATEVMGFEENPDVRIVLGPRKVTFLPNVTSGKVRLSYGNHAVILHYKDGRTLYRMFTHYSAWKDYLGWK